ncbi:MAG TPA: hypothetical protein VL125_13015 [Pelobium sp.]|nr:hypothetical protein [Pelobium sp.]
MRHYNKRVKALGGYLELQLPLNKEYYTSLIKLNTGRNAFEYLLRVNRYAAAYIPYFTCEVMLEPLRKLKIPYHFYTINRNLEPVLDFEVGKDECLLYTNYFGIKQDFIAALSQKVPNLIIDNTQGFFSEPVENIDTFYSCRKFFGVPDGAYLQSKKHSNLKFERDVSTGRMSHLLKCIDLSIEEGYENFVENNMILENNPIRTMSKLTGRLLKSIDYEFCKSNRKNNFQFLHQELGSYNKLVLSNPNGVAPLCYPLLVDKENVRKRLISKRIFIPTYWPNVFSWTTEKMFEYYLAKNLLPLPIDHRYNQDDMQRMVNYLKQLI